MLIHFMQLYIVSHEGKIEKYSGAKGVKKIGLVDMMMLLGFYVTVANFNFFIWIILVI